MEVSKKVLYEVSPYVIKSGRIKDEEPFHYLIINTISEVVEYETEVLPHGIVWAKHFADEYNKLMRGEESTEAPAGQNVLPFTGKPN